MLSNEKNLVLTGFMGTGKSTIGFLVAQSMQREFIDLDDYIEKIEQRTIAEIFQQSGELYFRQKEIEICNHVTQKTNCVIATGGGTLLQPCNYTLFQKSSVLICLHASWETIVQRIGHDKNRPLFAKQGEFLYKQRKKFYDSIPIQVSTEQHIEKIIFQIQEKYFQTNYFQE
ncbi:MAG: shikimate kinase [Planctomycetes bacterium]|jgi:shikimate kinase|nr:shikimate kinase [Planctomycetota bacterium]HPY75628.1 shikimate kinase [Planctomycetota bacterium]HQB00589.1 shikimate kinase [Planctomycetota bacterium]